MTKSLLLALALTSVSLAGCADDAADTSTVVVDPVATPEETTDDMMMEDSSMMEDGMMSDSTSMEGGSMEGGSMEAAPMTTDTTTAM